MSVKDTTQHLIPPSNLSATSPVQPVPPPEMNGVHASQPPFADDAREPPPPAAPDGSLPPASSTEHRKNDAVELRTGSRRGSGVRSKRLRSPEVVPPKGLLRDALQHGLDLVQQGRVILEKKQPNPIGEKE